MMFAPQTNKAIQLDKLLRRDSIIMYKSAMKCDLKALDPHSYMTETWGDGVQGQWLSSRQEEEGMMAEVVSIFTVF